jgi:transketolase N-terminal domain/subunit
MDAVQASNSGHPGTPMAMAPTAYWLWQRFLRSDPVDPIWPNRDRFVSLLDYCESARGARGETAEESARAAV